MNKSQAQFLNAVWSIQYKVLDLSLQKQTIDHMIVKQPQSYHQNEEEQETYKQQLGLKKMLYKYEHENEQLKSQIKALTQRLADIISKNDEQPNKEELHLQPADEYRLNLLKQQMKKLYADIERVTIEIKLNKELINEQQELKYIEVQNQVRKEQKQIQGFKIKLDKFERMQQMKGFAIQSMDLKNSELRITTHSDKLQALKAELQVTRKSIRQMEKYRDQHDRNQIKRQMYFVNLNSQTRKLSGLGKEQSERQDEPVVQKKGVWHMDYNEENYAMIKAQLSELKKQKNRIIDSLRNENIVLKRRYAELSIEIEQLNKSVHLPAIDIKLTEKPQGKPSFQKSLVLPKSNQVPLPPKSPPKLLNVGPKQFERNNDKNYSPKKLHKVQWQSDKNRTDGIEWSDAHLRSPIIGINLWFDGHLIGLQFLHRLGESTQHLHLTTKVISPIQYRLGTNDYLQNVVLWISETKIAGIQLYSKGGRNDSFGNRGKGRKFDFGIKSPQKPVFSFGKFRISNNSSQITKLGFEVV